MIKIKMALNQLISGTCDNAKKYNGERKKENGIRNNFIVEDESMLLKII